VKDGMDERKFFEIRCQPNDGTASSSTYQAANEHGRGEDQKRAGYNAER